MKRIAPSFIIFACALVWGKSIAQPATGSWANVNKLGEGELNIVYYDQVGLVEKNRAGQLQGFCIDLLNQFVAFVEMKYNKKVTLKYFQEEDFNKFYQWIDQQPYWLGVGNISITEERKIKYKFTPSYMPNILQLITNGNTPTISRTDEIALQLKGYTGYAISSSISRKVLEKMKRGPLPSINIISKDTGLLTIEAVSNDPKGFSVIDFTELLAAKRKNLSIKFHPVKMEKTEDLGFIMSKKSDWDAVWREFLTEEHKSSAEFKKSVVKYLGSDFLAVVTSKR